MEPYLGLQTALLFFSLPSRLRLRRRNFRLSGGNNRLKEGAKRVVGFLPSIWDDFSHSPAKTKVSCAFCLGNFYDGSNGDVAVDQHQRYEEVIELIAKLGFKAFRFSISWTRIFPDGLGTVTNDEGLRHYGNLINALIDGGIEPSVTLHHWDLPLNLHKSFGGWLSKNIVKYFAIYAETCFTSFVDRVKKWITTNEPHQTAVNGYCAGIYAPGRRGHSSTEPHCIWLLITNSWPMLQLFPYTETNSRIDRDGK